MLYKFIETISWIMSGWRVSAVKKNISLESSQKQKEQINNYIKDIEINPPLDKKSDTEKIDKKIAKMVDDGLIS